MAKQQKKKREIYDSATTEQNKKTLNELGMTEKKPGETSEDEEQATSAETQDNDEPEDEEQADKKATADSSTDDESNGNSNDFIKLRDNKPPKDNRDDAEKDGENPADRFNRLNGIGASEDKPKQKQKKNVIGEEQIANATMTLKKYKSQKANLDRRIIENEQWWKIKNWEALHRQGSRKREIEASSGWLFNSIMNKLADFSDNFPEPNIRARTAGDAEESERLKNVIPMILDRNDYEQVYDDAVLSKLKNGTSITGVFWDKNKDGIGDVSIVNMDMLSVYWQPGITDIQKSRNIFTCELVDTDVLKDAYPEFKEEIQSGDSVTLAKYIYEDYVDTTEKSCVIDWYYKKNGYLHYCKYVNNIVLFSTENEPEDYPNGLYDNGDYPFVVDRLFKMEGSIAGFGYIDVGRNPQEYIDLIDSSILQNTLMRATPRYFSRYDSEINEDEFLDWRNPLVKSSANLGEDALREITINGLDSYVFEQRDRKVDELKETTANRDVSTGGTTSGVTAASAISALIETGSKGSRYAIKGTYRAFKKIIYQVIERMRQFYDMPRFVRITGEDGTETYDTYQNAGLKMQTTQTPFNTEARYLPEFDIEVTAQKASPYAEQTQNQLALQFYQFGFFNPQNTDQSLACLEMMEFDNKSEIIKKIKQNGTIYDALMQAQQQVQQLQEQVQKLSVLSDLYVPGSNLTGQAGAGGQQQAQSNGKSNSSNSGKPQGVQQSTAAATTESGGNSLAEQAKTRASNASSPR